MKQRKRDVKEKSFQDEFEGFWTFGFILCFCHFSAKGRYTKLALADL